MLTTGVVAVLIATLVSAPAPERRVLYDAESSYPRVIRLEHSGPANGTILTSITTNFDTQGAGVISASTDGGETFRQIAAIEDPASAHSAGICCSSLYELPSAVGAMPAGTVLWAVTVGYQATEGQRRTRQRLWASSDVGQTWRHVSDIAVSPNQYNTWEPSLSVAADGTLVAFYSDETDKTHHDQKLVQVRSADGITWTDYQETVVNTDWYVRPGMINTIRLPDGSYFMTYEVCNNDPVHPCSAYFRRSSDGWDFGDPYDLGTVIRTAAGKYGRHTPTVAWGAGPGSSGTVLVITQMLVEQDGRLAPGNGKTILANDHVGAGPWYEIPAPIPVEGVNNEECRNYSPYLLPSPDGTAVLEVTTDYDGPICKTYYATGPLTPLARR
ncbi:exo-alpha-sialidase [Kibdelosporangium aridum]|uniref:Exo-alpha-sialidase n=1 Tax=Kibdelosporangium aridum TaxID=2030 RepID=A0A428XX81_KIBAR|nr:sialidase family protein [Kibdelosporangium aridum]RSM59935.1 exo-alpha-sialidase [Kibdelosporangium aridum]